jgi:hypothetical protein
MNSNSDILNPVGLLSAIFTTPVGLIGVLFVGLKLTGCINWSWWMVTLPFCGGFSIFLFLGILVGVFGFFLNE